MTIIELPDDQAAALKAKAATQGLSLKDWFKNLAATNVPPMTSLNWSQCAAVESIPGKRSGAWVFRDSRTAVSAVFENLEAGATISEVMDWFHLSHDQVTAVLEFAARSLDAPPVMPASALPPNAHPVR